MMTRPVPSPVKSVGLSSLPAVSRTRRPSRAWRRRRRGAAAGCCRSGRRSGCRTRRRATARGPCRGCAPGTPRARGSARTAARRTSPRRPGCPAPAPGGPVRPAANPGCAPGGEVRTRCRPATWAAETSRPADEARASSTGHGRSAGWLSCRLAGPRSAGTKAASSGRRALPAPLGVELADPADRPGRRPGRRSRRRAHRVARRAVGLGEREQATPRLPGEQREVARLGLDGRQPGRAGSTGPGPPPGSVECRPEVEATGVPASSTRFTPVSRKACLTSRDRSRPARAWAGGSRTGRRRDAVLDRVREVHDRDGVDPDSRSGRPAGRRGAMAWPRRATRSTPDTGLSDPGRGQGVGHVDLDHRRWRRRSSRPRRRTCRARRSGHRRS